MKLFPFEVEISEKEGFTREGDIFNRKPFADNLSSLLSEIDEPVVLAIDGAWGSGKTTFLKMWASQLRRDGFPVVYFDAFSSDYFESAFVALAGEIIDIAQKAGAPSEKIAKFKKTAKYFGSSMLKHGVKIGIRVATAGALDAAELKGASAELVKSIQSEADTIFSDLLDAYAKDKTLREKFSLSLSDLSKNLAESSESEARPLIFFVDELDRCKPDFALEILENIKHFFQVKNIHFVFGINMRQMENSVRAAYGQDIDANNYLQKFIQIRVALPVRNEFRGRNDRLEYVDKCFTAYEFPPERRGFAQEAFAEIGRIAVDRKLSFRQIQQCLAHAALSAIYVPTNVFRPPWLVGALCVLRVTSPEKFEQAKIDSVRYEDIEGDLALLKKTNDAEYDPMDRTRMIWRFLCSDSIKPEDEQEVYRLFSPYHLDRKGALRFLCTSVVDAFSMR